MSTVLDLELFDGPTANSKTHFLSGDTLTELKRLAFEAGRAQGYEVAAKEFNAQEAEVSSILAQKIQETAFTHFEARQAIMDTLSPLIKKIIEVLAPQIAANSLPELVVEQVISAAKNQTDGPVKIYCAPDQEKVLEAVLTRMPEIPGLAAIVSEPSFQSLEVRIASPRSDCQIDLDRVLGAIQSEITAFFGPQPKEANHG